MALHWSIASKNALSNVYGCSPSQLVFDRNTNLPSAFHNKPQAQNATCRSRYIARNLATLHNAQEAFIQQDACEKLQSFDSTTVIWYITSEKVHMNGMVQQRLLEDTISDICCSMGVHTIEFISVKCNMLQTVVRICVKLGPSVQQCRPQNMWLEGNSNVWPCCCRRR